MASGTVKPGEPPAEPPPIKPVSDPLHERRRLHPSTRLPILNKILTKEVSKNGALAFYRCFVCEKATETNVHQAEESEQVFDGGGQGKNEAL
jgi:hypothetical protein